MLVILGQGQPVVFTGVVPEAGGTHRLPMDTVYHAKCPRYGTATIQVITEPI